MNTNPPTAEQFLAQHEPDEDEVEPFELADLRPHIAQIAEAVKRLADYHTKPIGEQFTAELASTEAPHDWARKAAESAESVHTLAADLDDLEAKHQTVLQVISDVEAALGKSKAAPALAAKAVIDAWRNPQVSDEDPGDVCPLGCVAVGDHRETGCIVVDPEAEAATMTMHEPSKFPGDPVEVSREEVGLIAPLVVEGHTRVPHPDGFEFCQECSGATQQWVEWPCASAQLVEQGFQPQTEPDDSAAVPQPAHNAPVEEWREYARALGYAGPEIDKANRSVIRTTLGIAQPTPEAGA